MPKRVHRGVKRTVAQREDDLVQLALHCREGGSERKMVEWIAANRPYTLSQTMVHLDVVELRRRWQAESTETVAGRVARQLASLDAQEAEAWRAWRLSKGEVKEVLQEQVADAAAPGAAKKPPSRVKAVVRTSTSHGDPRYLALVGHVVEARNRLLGLTKTRTEVTGADGGPVAIEDKTEPKMHPDVLRKIIAMAAAETGEAPPPAGDK